MKSIMSLFVKKIRQPNIKVDDTPFTPADLQLLKTIVLPDGRYVEIHSITLGHCLIARNDNQVLQMAGLISMTVLIDNNSVSLNDVMNMDVCIVNTIIANMKFV